MGDDARTSFVHGLVVINNVRFWCFSLHYFLILKLYCYAILYRYTRGKSCGTLVKNKVPSLVTVRKVGNLPSRTSSLGRSTFTTTEQDSLSVDKSKSPSRD